MKFTSINHYFKKIDKNDKIAVAVSGGVDSTFLLYYIKVVLKFKNVIAITMKHLQNNRHDSKSCCSISEISILKDICWSVLNVMHYSINLINEFQKNVIDNFNINIIQNNTPNPCSICNQKIKFDHLRNIILKQLNAKYLVFGHYIIKDKNNNLFISYDKKKDQTYFLSLVKKKNLTNILFPLGKVYKKDIWKFVKKNNLLGNIFINKKESSGVCFITKKWKKYISTNFKKKIGYIINKKNHEYLGKINNIYHFTVGQKIFIHKYKKFFFVYKKIKNYIIVNCKRLRCFFIQIKNINFFIESKINNTDFSAQLRYHERKYKVKIFKFKEKIFIFSIYRKFINPTSGQILCIYKKQQLILGSIII